METPLMFKSVSTELVLFTTLITMIVFPVMIQGIKNALYYKVTRKNLITLIIASVVGGATMSYFAHEAFGWPLYTILLFAVPGFIYVVSDIVHSRLKKHQSNTNN